MKSCIKCQHYMCLMSDSTKYTSCSVGLFKTAHPSNMEEVVMMSLFAEACPGFVGIEGSFWISKNVRQAWSEFERRKS